MLSIIHHKVLLYHILLGHWFVLLRTDSEPIIHPHPHLYPHLHTITLSDGTTPR